MFSPRFSLPGLAAKVAKLCLTAFLVLISTGGFAQTTIQAREADRFVDSMGVNVHMEYMNTPYRHYAAINQKLQELGMRHFRDEMNDTHPSFVRELKKIGELGYSLCGVIEGGNDYPKSPHRLDPALVGPMIQDLLPTIDAVEGPNEPDGSAFVYGPGLEIYPKGAIDESEDLWNIVRTNSAISFLPVLAMSEANAQDFPQLAAITPPPIDYATYGNMHAYQGGDVGDSGLADWFMPYARDLTGDAPLWTTEMGYHNNTSFLTDSEQQGVSQRAAAIYLPIAFLRGFDRGVLRTFSYELIDEFYDPHLSSGKGDGHYGLLNFDGTPKPAFDALKNLIALLQERGANDFEPGSLTITFSAAPATMRYVLLEKSSGDYYLAIWNNVRVYRIAALNGMGNVVPGEDLYPRRVPITVTFNDPKALTVYAPNDASGVNPTDAYTIATTSRSIRLDVPPKVLLMKIVDENPRQP